MSDMPMEFPQYTTHPRLGGAHRINADGFVQADSQGYQMAGVDGVFDKIEDLQAAAHAAGLRFQYTPLRGTPRSSS